LAGLLVIALGGSRVRIGLKAGSIMRDAGTFTPYHAARMIGRAVGAEYRSESISWGDAPGWDDGGALPLKNRGFAPEESGFCA
jgi:hypothetical protein